MTAETAARRQRQEYVISELEYLINSDAPESLARRLGYSNVASLQRKLNMWGRNDLAQRLNLLPLYPRDVNVIGPTPRRRTRKSRQKVTMDPAL